MAATATPRPEWSRSRSWILPPCVPAAFGDRGTERRRDRAGRDRRRRSRSGTSAAKPDPTFDALLAGGGRIRHAVGDRAGVSTTTPTSTRAVYELYGRKVQLVKIQGTGTSTDEVAAKADADQAAADGVFAVMGGPDPGAELRSRARPQAHPLSRQLRERRDPVDARRGHAVPVANRPDSGAGRADDHGAHQEAARRQGRRLRRRRRSSRQPRKFALLSYDTPDGVYKASWDQFYNDLQAAGAPIVGHISYFLNLASLASDARTVASKLKATGATTIVFTGDPIFPEYLTKAMTAAELLPRVGHGRHRARRHQRVRPHLRPDSSGNTRSGCSSSPHACRRRNRTPTRCTSGGSVRRRPPRTTTRSSRATSSS